MEPAPANDDALLGLPFDAYERYSLTARIISAWRPSGPIRILDVGGQHGALKGWLRDDLVVAVDPLPPTPFAYRESVRVDPDAYVRGEGGALPFADGSFDVVSAHDTLEHVPSADRDAFLRDLLRVARHLVIVNGPVAGPEVAPAERRLAKLWRSVLGQAVQGPLREHIELGVPDQTSIERVLTAEGARFADLPNGDVGMWLVAMGIKHYLFGLPGGSGIEEEFDRLLNRHVAPTDFSDRSYRRAYVVAPSGSAADVEELRRSMPAPRPSPVGSIDELEPFLQSLEDHGARFHAPGAEELYAGVVPAGYENIVLAAHAKLADFHASLARSEREVQELRRALQDIRGSAAHRALIAVRRAIDRAAPWGTRRRGAILAPARAIRMLSSEGLGAVLLHFLKVWVWVPKLFRPAIPAVDSEDQRYNLWLYLHMLSPRRLRVKRRELQRLEYRPTISIVMPTYNTDPEWLWAAVASVRRQMYPHWQLCIADDASTREDTRALLRELEIKDQRIEVRWLEENRGIAGASNAALELASGEFVGFLDHDDELQPNALFEVAKRLNEERDLDYLYSDEDKAELDGRLTTPFFKPDWSPELLMSVNYVTHFSVYRREVLERVGGFREGYDGSQDYDLVLRVAEQTDRIGHIPLPLYSWRKVPGSAAASLDYKDYAYEAGTRVLEEALERRGQRGTVEEALVEGRYRVRYEVEGTPKVTIVIPTRDKVDLLRACVDSVRRRTTYPNYEIVIVDNQSEDPRTLEFLRSFGGRVISYPHEFNYARMMNVAVREVGETDFILFLNNDTEVVTLGWLESMVEHGQRREIAAVGARLLFPNGNPQHEGIAIGLGGVASNLDHGGYFRLGETIRNCSAVTGACLLMRPEVFWELGGFEERLRVAYNDVDICLRAREKGYLIVYTPYALLYHDESSTRGPLHPEEDDRLFRERWGDPEELRDPYYNPCLSKRRPFELELPT